MKRILSVLLALLMIATTSVTVFSAFDSKSKKLCFNSDGKFRIMMVNDFQDDEIPEGEAVKFVEKALDYATPDLVIFVGDQLASKFPTATKMTVKSAIRRQMELCNFRHIPFLFTFGNHDHERENILSVEDQAKVYYNFRYCAAEKDGCDPGTYNKLIYGSDGSVPLFNVYMMDTNKNYADTWQYDGIHENQLEWYKAKSDELKAINGGNPMPSILFQHIPVKEIYSFLAPSTSDDENAVNFSGATDDDYYVFSDEKIISTDNDFHEAPCSEHIGRTTGQYEAWLEKGDIKYGAFFGHDHRNDFVGVTDDGITLGYNSGCGKKSYGLNDRRSVKLFDFDENNLDSCVITRVKYGEIKNVDFNLIKEIRYGFLTLFNKIFSFL